MYRVSAEQMPNWYQLKDNILISLFMDIPTKTSVKEERKTGTILARAIEVEQGRYNIAKYLKFGQYNKTVTDFYQNLETCFSEYNLSAFYRNMKTLTITNKKRNFSDYLESLIIKQPSSATYYDDTNTVHITEDKNASTRSMITRELLKMSTTREGENVTFCGFSQHHKDKKTSIGDALNLGYTDYLNQKYFNRDYLDECNQQEQIIAQGIENIVGSRRMEALYFESDLRSLINELAKYTTIDNAMDLIRNFDKIQKKQIDESLKEKEYKELRQQIADIYLAKQTQLLDRGTISEQEFADRKIMYADIYVNESVVFAPGAQLSRENGALKIIDSNRGVAVITSNEKYHHMNNEPTVEELVAGSYSYQDTLQKVVEDEHKRRG